MRRFAFTLLAVLLTAQLALAQCPPGGCPDGNCPPQQQIFGGDSWAPRGSPMGMIRPEVPRPQRQDVQAPVSTSTPPEWLCHVFGAAGMLIWKDDNTGVVLSAYHVPKGQPRDGIAIRFPDGSRYTGRVLEDMEGEISADKQYDVVGILISTPKASPCIMAEIQPAVGARIWTAGYGNGSYRVRSSVVQRYQQRSTLYSEGNHGDGSVGGDSGGAMINAAGELCGIISRSDWQLTPRGGIAGSETIGPSLRAIHALCADERFRWPWRDEIRQFGQDIGRIDRDKADRSEIPPVPPVQDPSRLPPAPSMSQDDVRRMMEQSQDRDAFGLAGAIDENRGRIVELEAWTPLLAELQDAKARLLAMNPDKLKTELGQEVQRDLKENLAKSEEVAKAAKALVDTVPGVAKTAAEDAVSAAVEDSTFLERLSGRLKIDGLVSDRLEAAGLEKTAGGVRWLWGLIIGTWVGYGFLLVIAGAIVWDIWAKLKYGHPLFLQTVTELAKKATPYIPTRIDDRLVNAADAGVDAAADAAAEKVRGWFGIELQQAVAEGVKQGIAAAKKGK